MARHTFLAAVVVALLGIDPRRAVAQPQGASIVGAWVLNAELSDKPPAPPERGGGDGREGRRGRGPGAGGFGGPGAGGPGGGRGGGGFGRGGGRTADRGGQMNREEMERRMNAIRDVVEPAERLTITRTDSMVIITTGDGRTTRLAPDNSKIKDRSSGIERRTRWDGERLVTEISGLGRGKATETYAIDPQTHQLIVEFEGAGARDERADSSRGGPGSGVGPRMPPVPKRRVYDPLQP